MSPPAILIALLVGFLYETAAMTLDTMAGPPPTPHARDFDSIETGFTPRPTQAPEMGLLELLYQPQHGVAAAVEPAPLVKREFEPWLCGYKSASRCRFLGDSRQFSVASPDLLLLIDAVTCHTLVPNFPCCGQR
jgi:hypothetical protein